MREGLEQLPVAGAATVEVAQGQWWLDTAPNPSTARMGAPLWLCVTRALLKHPLPQGSSESSVRASASVRSVDGSPVSRWRGGTEE